MRRFLLTLLAGCAIIWSQPAEATVVVLHWSYPVVYVADHTGYRWTGYVQRASISWDNGTTVSVRYGWCRAGAGCIRVYAGDYGATGWVGLTALVYSNSIISQATVRLNNYYRLDAHEHRVTACHEEGHGLGLPHQFNQSSCLYPTVSDAVAKWPNALDRSRLNAVY